MAASEPKPDDACPISELGKSEDLRVYHPSQDDRQSPGRDVYKGLDVIFYALTIAIYAATVITDFFVVIEHWLNTYKLWAYYTIGLAVVPSYFVQILSLKWYKTHGNLKKHQWISHIFHFAIMHRFCYLLNSAIKTMKTHVSSEQRDWIFRIESDAFTLNLFTSLLVSVPQIILQVYTMAILQHVSFWTSASVITSIFSLTWALTAYTLLTNRAIQDKSQFTWSSMLIQGFWRGGMLASRIAALVLAAICLKAWILVIFAIHLLGMTAWIIQQTTNFCLTAIEELTYKCLIGAVYFFDFLRLTDKQARYHVCVFYTVMIIQNAIFYAVYLISFKNAFQMNVLIVSTVMILGGTFVGATSMLIHFCMFQNAKTIKLCKRMYVNPSMSLKVSSSKSINKSPTKTWNIEVTSNESVDRITPDITADKKSLLTNIVQNTKTIEKGLINTSFTKSDETNVEVQVVMEDSKVANVDVSVEKMQNHSIPLEKKFENICSVDVSVKEVDNIRSSKTDSLHRQKRRGICSEIELDLKLSECIFDLESQMCSQKRRGICSLTQLGFELVTDEDNYVEKSFSSLDKLKSTSEISLNIEEKSLDSRILESLPIKNLITNDLMVPENILARGRLNTPVISENGETIIITPLSEKEEISQKQEEEVMSHVTSVHDYENLCPLGVARPPWCIRSWKGYTDIETYIHDDSIVRDRRRDTLTSTATGTTHSSDFSDAIYASFPLKKQMKRSRQDDYLDTLIYDLVDWESLSNTTPVEEVSTPTTTTNTLSSIEEAQDQANLFSAKPIVIDEKGGMLALDTIIEEREDHGSFPELHMSFHSPAAPCSVSSLVATIDEIRKCTAENSPRHVYHRTEPQWEDLEQKILMKRTHLTKVLLRNDYSNVTLNYSDPWGNSIVSNEDNDKLSIIREMTNYCLKDKNGKTPLINAILSDSPILGSKTETPTCEADDNLLEEDNVYVDMKALGTQRCSAQNDKKQENIVMDKDILLQSNLSFNNKYNRSTERNNVKKVSFMLPNEIINDMQDTFSEHSDFSTSKNTNASNLTPLSIDKRLRAINRPRRKFSLLRERFEPKSNEKVVCIVTPTSHNKNISNKPQLNALNKRISVIFNDPEAFDSSLNYDKENLTIKQPPTFENKIGYSDNFKEKRSIFLKQILLPPRFQGWSKRRTFSPNAKIISRAH